MKKAFDKTLHGNSVRNSFEICGLYPLHPDKVDYSKCDVSKQREVRTFVQENTNIASDSCPKHTAREGLRYMENFINPQTLLEFEMIYNLFTPVWNGDGVAHDLYVTWKKMKNQVQSNRKSHEHFEQDLTAAEESLTKIKLTIIPSMKLRHLPNQ